MSRKCGACNNPIVDTKWCAPCIRKYDTLRYSCTHCKALFDPNEEGVVGETSRFCGECCNTLDADETLIEDMADRMANGASWMEA